MTFRSVVKLVIPTVYQLYRNIFKLYIIGSMTHSFSVVSSLIITQPSTLYYNFGLKITLLPFK